MEVAEGEGLAALHRWTTELSVLPDRVKTTAKDFHQFNLHCRLKTNSK